MEGERQVKVEWRTSAIIDDNSDSFAKKLEVAMNEATAEGFVMVQMIHRAKDDGMVLVHQRTTYVPDGESEQGPLGEHLC
jgi:hypothetical protein